MFGNEKQTIKVEGMMCEHCAAHVKEALCKVEGVKGVKVDLAGKKVEIKSKGVIDEAKFKEAVEGAGYRYGGLC